jgi:hypothetical protein
MNSDFGLRNSEFPLALCCDGAVGWLVIQNSEFRIQHSGREA